MKKIFYILTACMFTLTAVSCDDSAGLSDEASVDTTTEEDVYNDVAKTRKVLYDLYGRTREVENANHGTFSRLKAMSTCCALLDNATDDGVGEVGSSVPIAQRYSTGAITASTNFVANTHPWNWYYTAIRQANGFLENVDNSVLEDTEKLTSKAQARFLRALYYHELYRWFGPVVILDERVDPFNKSFERASEEDFVKWLVAEFDALIAPGSGLEDVPEPNYYGIATRGAAYGYKARTLLYAASPLHKASGVTWQQAADAALDFIEWADGDGIYSLYVDPEDPSMSYAHLFNERKNSEYIYWYNNPDNNDIYHLFPKSNPWNVNKERATLGTQELVDSYDMIDGTSPFEYDEYGIREGRMKNVTCFMYDENDPYANRDPRLTQTLLHDGKVWPLVNGGPATFSLQGNSDEYLSGYFVCKFCDERVDHMKGGTVTMNFPMMRYAEILLDYAEAINEAQDSDFARNEAVLMLNRIRERAGIINPLVSSDYDQDSMRALIRKERRVELAWEEHRFFDIRRWQIAKVVMNRPVHGIMKNADGKYEVFSYPKRSYPERMDLFPIPVKDINMCPNLKQNPGY